MAGRTLVVLEHPIHKKRLSVRQTTDTVHIKPAPNGCVVGCGNVKQIWCTSKSPGDGWEMGGWLPLAISKDCGCNSRSLQDGWEITEWLAPTSSNEFGGHCKSPRDGWEIAGGWLAQEISRYFG